VSQATAVRTAGRPVGRPATRPAPAPARLRVVSAPPQTRSRAGLVFACIALLAAGLVGLLLLNVSLERGSYVLQDQQAKATLLQDEAQSLREQLASLEAPQNLATRATQLGMVPNPNAAFLRASDGRVLGVPKRAVATKAPTVTPAPTSTTTPATPSAGTRAGRAGGTPGGSGTAGRATGGTTPSHATVPTAAPSH